MIVGVSLDLNVVRLQSSDEPEDRPLSANRSIQVTVSDISISDISISDISIFPRKKLRVTKF
jgi:hypothetical protein